MVLVLLEQQSLKMVLVSLEKQSLEMVLVSLEILLVSLSLEQAMKMVLVLVSSE